MKKFIGLISICLTLVLSLGLAGCGANEKTLSYSLEYNINKLTNVLNDTKEANNNDLIVPELYSFEASDHKVNKTTINNRYYKNKNNPTSYVPNTKKINNNDVITTSASFEKTSSNQTYVPKRAPSINYENPTYTTYKNKVEDLYIMINEAVYANETIKECKENIFSYCQILNEIAKKINAGEIELSQDQINSCNKLLKELGRSINKITDTRNEVSKNCKAFAEKSSLNNGVDTISSNYVTLINCLDTRITDYENILTLLGQIQCVLTDTCYNQDLNNSTDNSEAVQDLVEDYYKNNCFTNENGTYCPRASKTPSTYPFFKNETIDKDNSTTQTDNDVLKNTPKTLEDPIIEEENKEVKPSKNIDTYSNTSLSKKYTSETNNSNSTTNQNSNSSVVNQPATPPVVQTPIQNGNGIANNGIVGNGIIGNGYGYGIGAPIHNYENGVMNPYRNTDTYKLPTTNPLGNGMNGYNYTYGTRILNAENQNLLQKPLPQERRKDFKTFSEIKPFKIHFNIENNENESEKTKINSSSLSKYNETNKSPITKETLKNNLKKFVNP